MKKETAKIISKVKSPSMMDLLAIHGKGRMDYDSYRNNAHNTTKVQPDGSTKLITVDFNELEQICKTLYINWRTHHLKNYERWQASHPGKIIKDYEKLKQLSPEQIEADGTSYIEIVGDTKYSFPDIPMLGHNQDGFFLHIKTGNATGIPEEVRETRLYLNLKAENSLEFSKQFIKKCQERGLFGYFKFSPKDNRNDTWLVYCSYENLPEYVEIIEEIKRENPKLLEGTEAVSKNMGVLNGYIGYGEQPFLVQKDGTLKQHGLGSHNLRLGHTCNAIYRDIAYEARQQFNFKSGFNLTEKGTQNKAFEQAVLTYVKQKISPYINEWLKTPEGKAHLAERNYTPERFLELCAQDYVGRLQDYLLSNRPIEDLTGKTLKIPFSSIINVDEMCEQILPQTKGQNRAYKERAILQMFYSPEGKMTPELKSFTSKTLKYIRKALAEYIKQNPKDSDAKALYNEFINATPNAQNQACALALRILRCRTNERNFVLITSSGREINITENFNLYEMLVEIVGKDKVEEIARHHCIENNVDYDNVCYNGHTQAEIDKALSSEKQA